MLSRTANCDLDAMFLGAMGGGIDSLAVPGGLHAPWTAGFPFHKSSHPSLLRSANEIQVGWLGSLWAGLC